MKHWKQIALALGHAGLWVLALSAIVASYGLMQHRDEQAEAAAQWQLTAAAVVDLGAPDK